MCYMLSTSTLHDRRGLIMLERKVNNLVLTGEDARLFAHSLYHPSREHIIRYDRILDDIERNISLTEYPNGFSAEIKDLDLGFLEDFGGVT